jgi:hypothetical protein
MGDRQGHPDSEAGRPGIAAPGQRLSPSAGDGPHHRAEAQGFSTPRAQVGQAYEVVGIGRAAQGAQLGVRAVVDGWLPGQPVGRPGQRERSPGCPRGPPSARSGR